MPEEHVIIVVHGTHMNFRAFRSGQKSNHEVCCSEGWNAGRLTGESTATNKTIFSWPLGS